MGCPHNMNQKSDRWHMEDRLSSKALLIGCFSPELSSQLASGASNIFLQYPLVCSWYLPWFLVEFIASLKPPKKIRRMNKSHAKSNGNNIFQNTKRGIPVFLVELGAKPTTITWGSDVVLRGHFPGRRSWRGSSRFYRLSPGNRVRSTASPIYMGESWWTLGYHRAR